MIPPINIPSNKNPILDAQLKEVTGIDCIKAITTLTCPFCSKPVTGFRDELSQREHTISGLCQNCQDEVFKPSDI